tara:strand:- start:96 stop:1049 length:954 start_codon:yes stop_codon:yes gene_type:complete
MQKKIILIFLILFVSCGRLPDSKGEFNEIIVISSKEDRSIYENDINNLFGEYINTPSEESLYILKWVDEDKFQYYLSYKNILLVNLNEPADSTIDNLIYKFKNQYNKSLFVLDDVYAKNQNLFIFSSDNYSQFQDNIIDNGSWILDNIDDKINSTLYDYIYRNGNNEEIEAILDGHFGIRSFIQKDFLVVKDKLSKDDFIWLGRGYPYRWLCFNKVKNITELDSWKFFKLSVSEHMPNVIIKDYYKKVSYESDDIIKIEGLYEEMESDTGGPFVVYVKFNSLDRTALFISGFVNNPGKPKIRLLKELEIQILNNLKN